MAGYIYLTYWLIDSRILLSATVSRRVAQLSQVIYVDGSIPCKLLNSVLINHSIPPLNKFWFLPNIVFNPSFKEGSQKDWRFFFFINIFCYLSIQIQEKYNITKQYNLQIFITIATCKQTGNFSIVSITMSKFHNKTDSNRVNIRLSLCGSKTTEAVTFTVSGWVRVRRELRDRPQSGHVVWILSQEIKPFLEAHRHGHVWKVSY